MWKNKEFKFKYEYKKEHGIYLVLSIIIIFLGLFLFNNFAKCKVYSLSIDHPSYNLEDGIIVLTTDKSILKINNIGYDGQIENVISVVLTLCVDVDSKCNAIASVNSNASEGMNYAYYLKNVSFDLNEDMSNTNIFTKKVKKNIEDNLFLQVSLITSDGETHYDLIPINVDMEYSNNKLFY